MSKPRTIADMLPALTQDILGRRGLLFGKMISEWPAIAGDIAARAIPTDLKFTKKQEGKSQAVLHLSVSSADALEISYQKSLLIERLNAFFGYGAIKDIKLIHQNITDNKKTVKAPMRPLTVQETQNLDTTVCKIQENDLQAALKNLGKAIISCSHAENMKTDK